MTDVARLTQLAKELTDKGRLIEAGWVGLRIAAISPEAPLEQLREMRQAFFAGALHLFSSIMAIMDTEDDATDDDLRRMDQIKNELDEFGEQLKRDVMGDTPVKH